MPKGSKTCKSCGTANGPRSFVCSKCGTSFTFKQNKSTISVVSKKHEVSNKVSIPFTGKYSRKRTVLIPSGECPVKLTDFSPEGVIVWSEKIRSLNENVVYTYTALEYWMRDFVDERSNPQLFEELTSVIS